MTIADLIFIPLPSEYEMYGASIYGRNYIVIKVKGGYTASYQDIDSRRVWIIHGMAYPALTLEAAMLACMRNLNQ